MANCRKCGSWCTGTFCRGCMAVGSTPPPRYPQGASAPCKRCYAPTTNPGGLCNGCSKAQQNVNTDQCASCGGTFPVSKLINSFNGQNICDGCMVKYIWYQSARAAATCQQCNKVSPAGLTAGICDSCQLRNLANAIPKSNVRACSICGMSFVPILGTSTIYCRYCVPGPQPPPRQNSPFRRPFPAPFQQQQQQGSPNMAQNVRIWWDPSVSAYKMVTPFNASFVETLKALIPVSDRVWDPVAKQWTFLEAYLDPISTLVERLFGGKPTVLSKQQVESMSGGAQGQSNISTTKGSPLDVTICAFFRLLPYDAAKTAFRKAAMELHPDKNNGDSGKMSDLNMAWSRIEKDLYGK